VARQSQAWTRPVYERLAVVETREGHERDPRARVQVGGRTLAVEARRATPEERARLWPVLERRNPFYARYEAITAREIPVVALRPTSR